MPVWILLHHRSRLPGFETSMPMISDKVWAGEEIVKSAFEHGMRSERREGAGVLISVSR